MTGSNSVVNKKIKGLTTIFMKAVVPSLVHQFALYILNTEMIILSEFLYTERTNSNSVD